MYMYMYKSNKSQEPFYCRSTFDFVKESECRTFTEQSMAFMSCCVM